MQWRFAATLNPHPRRYHRCCYRSHSLRRTSLAASVCDLRPGMSHARASGNGMRQPLPPVAADGPKLEEEGEGEETAEEAYRRRQWIIYFVSVGKYTEALDIGWDNLSPPDPRHPLAAAPGHAR